MECEKTITIELDNSESSEVYMWDIYLDIMKHPAFEGYHAEKINGIQVTHIRLGNRDGSPITYEQAVVFKPTMPEGDFVQERAIRHQQSVIDIPFKSAHIIGSVRHLVKVEPQKHIVVTLFLGTETYHPELEQTYFPSDERKKEIYITGDIKYTTHAEEVMRLGEHSQAPVFIEKLQDLMLEYGVVKIDIAIDPYKF